MNQTVSYLNSKLDKAMTEDQFNQVIEAILAGKYSWACVLILRFAGYNPLHYIPYRTYNRLLKDNCQIGNANKHKSDNLQSDDRDSESTAYKTASKNSLSKIKELTYLEVISH